MLNKQKIIKVSIFFVVISTLFINLVYLGFTEYCREYATYNNKIAFIFNKNKNQETKANEYREVCLKLKPNSLIPVTNTLSSWSGLMILVSVVTMIIVAVSNMVFRKKIFSKKEKVILLSAILLSSGMLFHISLIELNFYYWTWNCSQFF